MPQAGTRIFLNNEFFCLIYDASVVLVGEHLAAAVDLDPANLGDLVLLRAVIGVFGFADEIHHDLLSILARRIRHYLTERGVKVDFDACLLEDFTLGGLLLGLVTLNMAFRERPVSAVDVLYQQYFRVAVVLAVHNGATGFFMQHYPASFLCEPAPCANEAAP